LPEPGGPARAHEVHTVTQPAHGSRPAQSMPEALARTLRHEVGDLLQTIYATVAILQERLPRESTLERRVLTDLRSRAEVCRNLLDNVHDLVCPVTLATEEVDLSALVAMLVTAAGPRHPDLEVRADTVAAVRIEADPRRVGQVGSLLLANACAEARHRVVFRSAPGPVAGEAEWAVTDDGPGVPPEQADQLFSPLSVARHGHLGIGLPLARKLVELHGGRITAGNLPEGGFRVTVLWPARPPAHG